MKKLLILFLVLLGVGISSIQAQQNLISGTVVDSVSAERLPGASVYLEGTTNAVSSGLSGDFSLSTAKTGPVVLVISYIGYGTSRLSLDLKSGETVNVKIELAPLPGQLSEVIVRGALQGQAMALNQQRTSTSIVNVIAADQIGRFPDPNAAEALQRVQGVNIERDQGEGRYVLIRGLAPQFTNVSINGEQIPSPEADVRYVALDAVPSDQLASIEISKTFTPDQDADAIGGSVNLITRTATSSEPTIRASAVLGYNNLMEKTNGQGSLQYGQRFLNNKLGVMLNTSYYTNNLGSDNWERDTDGDLLDITNDVLELRDYELTRTRTGLSGTIDYKFNVNNEIYIRSIYNRFTDREWRRRYVFVPEDEEIEKLVKDRFEEQSITSVNVGGRHTFPKFSIDYEGAYSFAEQDTPYDNEVGFIAGDMVSDIDYSNNEFPRLSTTPSYLNNSLYEFDAFENGSTIAKDENITAKANISVPYSTGNSTGVLKFGGKVRFKTKSFDITQNVYSAISDVPTADAFEGGLLDEDFLSGEYTLSAFPDMDRFISYFNSNLNRFELEFEDKIVDEALESYEATEDVYAAYLMTTHRFNKLTAVGGIRYERTDVSYNSQEVVFGLNGDLLEVRNVSGTNDYDFILPQLNLKYEIDENTIIRGAATYSYARPNFIDIIPAQEANLNDREASIGNPEINPVSAFNLDLFGEKYLQKLGLISGGVFYKQLDDFIYTRRFLASYPLNVNPPLADGIIYTQAQNGEVANLFGVELGFQRQLDFLPGVLKNMAVYVNYTYTASDAEFQRGDDTRFESIPLPGQAESVGNFALAYNSKKISLRAAINFNGAYLSEIGATADDDLYVNDRLQFDLTAGYRINDHFKVFAEFLNLTNQPFEVYSGSDDNFVQREFYSWWSRIGIKYDLN